MVSLCVRDLGQRNQLPDQIQEVQRFYSLQFVVRQTGVASGKQGQKGQFQVRNSEAGLGQVRADEGVVPRSRQSRSRGQTKTETGIQSR